MAEPFPEIPPDIRLLTRDVVAMIRGSRDADAAALNDMLMDMTVRELVRQMVALSLLGNALVNQLAQLVGVKPDKIYQMLLDDPG